MMSFVGMESNFNIYIENKFVANNEIIKWKHSQSEYLYFCYFLKLLFSLLFYHRWIKPFIWNIYILHMPSVLKQYLQNHANQWKYLLNPMFTNNTIEF